ncbi:AraC family transcriptional regulator [Sodalis glossinidius]|uniref:AraC family transcriptional regulator n=1 Tax=Sodalis glossinidius TaxID=63612 RepID=UPI0018E08FC8|nr:AraC family transcriptional regulator [Sodalis glossinidius]
MAPRRIAKIPRITWWLPVMGSVIKASASHPYLCLQLDLDSSELSDLAIRHPAPPRDESPLLAGLTLNKTSPLLLDAAIHLVGPNGCIIRNMVLADSRLNQIARAILWIRTHFREPYRIDNAAEIAGMSRSTFYLHFKAVTTLSPIEFRTHLRLQEAQRLMVSEAADAASAGFQVGYESPSQFSRDYARIFGMYPAKHAHRLR